MIHYGYLNPRNILLYLPQAAVVAAKAAILKVMATILGTKESPSTCRTSSLQQQANVVLVWLPLQCQQWCHLGYRLLSLAATTNPAGYVACNSSAGAPFAGAVLVAATLPAPSPVSLAALVSSNVQATNVDTAAVASPA